MSLLACLIPAVFLATVAAQTTTGGCPGGYKENDVVDKGVYWYRCVNGALVPQGCLSSSTRGAQRIGDGQSFVNDKNIEVTCLRKDDQLQFVQTACMQNGQRIAPDHTYDGTDAWYVCERANDIYLLWKPAGCIYNGKHVNFFDRVRDATTVYECQKSTNPITQLVAVGCVHNGQDKMVGEQYTDATVLFTCELDGNKAVERVFGCVHDGKNYFDYQVYSQGQQIFRCVVNTERTQAKPEVCGCVQKMKKQPPFEKLIGCFWEQDDEDKSGESYLMNCKKDEQGNAYTERVRCIYKDNEGNKMELDPGCFRNVANSNQAVGCVVGEQGIQITSFASDRLDVAFSNRLRFC